MVEFLEGLGQVSGREYSFLACPQLSMSIQTWTLDQKLDVAHCDIETGDDIE